MLWLIPVGIGVGVGVGLKLLYDAVSEQETQAYSNWQSQRANVEKGLDEHQKSIEAHLFRAQSSYDFYFLKDLHFSSVQVANSAYQILDDARQSLSGINKFIVAANERRGQLQQTLDNARASNDKALARDAIEQLKMVNELRKNAFNERDALKQEQANLLAELKKLNNRTRELKDLINSRCGSKGRDWYNRLEARKQQKRRLATA